MTNEELIREAASVLKPITDESGRVQADVGAALLSKNGTVYKGVCIDAPSWGICAERSAIAAMVTDAGEYEFQKVAAVWRDEKTGKLHVLPPCGHCREFMRAVNKNNLEADVVLGKSEVKKLKELIPNFEWPQPLE
jgi:cytidine deaminase